MSSHRYTPEFNDEAVRQGEVSRRDSLDHDARTGDIFRKDCGKYSIIHRPTRKDIQA